MSRRRTSDSHRDYAMVRLFCPHGHEINRVLRPDPEVDEYALTNIEGRGDFIDPETDKLRLTCHRCNVDGGRRVDLQASWPRVRRLLDEIAEDPTRGTESIIAGE